MERPARMNGAGATMWAEHAQELRLKLVEQYAGVGSLRCGDRTLAAIPHRIEGTLALAGAPEAAALVGADVTLELEDGRSLKLTVADESGRVLAEGHGP